jgi:serine/threonine-protein kinase RsbW
VRLAVSAVAERVGFDIEDIEDLKVASAEACTLLLSAGADTIDISLVVQSGLELLFEAQGTSSAPPAEQDGLSQYLLDALVDTCEIINEGGTMSVRLKKAMPL